MQAAFSADSILPRQNVPIVIHVFPYCAEQIKRLPVLFHIHIAQFGGPAVQQRHHAAFRIKAGGRLVFLPPPRIQRQAQYGFPCIIRCVRTLYV